MRALFQFILRNPWLYVVLAFVVLIGAWITAYVLASGIPLREVPLNRGPGTAPLHSKP